MTESQFLGLGKFFSVVYLCVYVPIQDVELTGNWRPLWVWMNTVEVREKQFKSVTAVCLFFLFNSIMGCFFY